MLQQRLVVKSPRVAHALRKARDLSPLGQVRAMVERDLLRARANQANEAIYDKLRANYRVRIEPAPVTAAPAG